jgi:hypothetical protein
MGLFYYAPPQTAGAAQPAAPRHVSATVEAAAIARPPATAPAFLTAVANVMAAWRDFEASNLGDDEAQEQRFGKVPTPITAASLKPPPQTSPGFLTALSNIMASWGDLDLRNLLAEQEQFQRFGKTPTATTAIPALPPTLGANVNIANILAQWVQTPAPQMPRFVADLISSSNPVVVAIGRAIMAYLGAASHANEVDAISHAALGFTGEPSHANEVDAITHAGMSFAGGASHANEVDNIGHATITISPKSLTTLGASIVSIAHAVIGFTCGNLSSGWQAIRAVYLNVWSMWTDKPRGRGF